MGIGAPTKLYDTEILLRIGEWGSDKCWSDRNILKVYSRITYGNVGPPPKKTKQQQQQKQQMI